jgi:serine/threonine protein phosphatase PrpC
MWKVVPVSVIGTSHEKADIPCQDCCDFLRISSGEGAILLVALADGAGSAALSHVGSFEAVHHLLSLASHSNLAPSEISKEKVREWMGKVLEHFSTVAEREKTTVSQLACTLLLGIIGESDAIFCQIGDGAWVAEKEGELIPVTWPQNGDFANITTFITSEGALETMQYERLTGSVAAIAGFTDGLQALALTFSTRTAHAPFFRPMFASVQSCEDETSLIAPLQAFLTSEDINNRTDDDKTVVLACRCDPKSE